MCRGNMQNTSLEFMVLGNEKLNCIGCVERQFRIGGG